jgi:hypothetical protein
VSLHDVAAHAVAEGHRALDVDVGLDAEGAESRARKRFVREIGE